MSLHINTPRMSVFEPRGLQARTVDYCRDIEGGPVESRVNRTLHDPAGRAVKQWDPRLWLSQAVDPLTPASLTQVFTLDTTVIRSDSVDAGTQIELKGLAVQTMFSWDSRQTRHEIEHDNLLRPVAIFEEGTGESRCCVERLTYGHPGSGDPSRNQFGQLIRHDHPAGSVLFNAFAILGSCTEDIRHFTLDPLTPDWPELEADRQRLLESGAGATSRWRHGALGDVLEQADARDNRHTLALTIDGRLRERRLQLKGEPEQTLVTDIRYNAQGKVTQQTAGNGVHTTRTYRSEDDRLLGLRSEDARGLVLQHLSYGYDRMGNVLSIEDKALPIRYFANQRIEPVSRFVYDSLSQLIMAFGWEAGSVSQGPQSIGRIDPAAVSNYQQTYEYDPGGNLRNLIHVGPQSHGRKLQPASYSNRSLPYTDLIPGDPEIEAAYDRRGNLLQLETGRLLSWNLRNQLQSVSPVERASGLNDQEVYLYDGSRRRVRKMRSSLANTRTLVADVRYLPGLELRTDNGTGERLQVIIADNARVQHWESPPPSGLNNRYRYQHADHLGSVSLETADDGAMISRETFHPFGTSAWQDGEFSYKYMRYSGKERDASRLDYYGYRYYISWLQKWSNPDPAGNVDGLNLFQMLRNSPINRHDENGLSSYDVLNEQETFAKKRNIQIISKGLDSFPAKERDAVRDVLEMGLDWIKNAEKALSQASLSLPTQKILTMMFDEQDFSSAGEKDSFTSLLLADMRELKSYMTILLEDRRQMVLVDQLPGMDALAFNTANDGNFIWVSQSFLERSHSVSQARTMVHEASHAMRRHNDSNFVTDFMYLDFGEEGRAASKEDINDYVLLGRLASKVSMGTAPDESKFSARTLMYYKNAVGTALEKLGNGPATSPRKRADAYLSQVKVRQSVALRNADSLSVFAMQFRR